MNKTSIAPSLFLILLAGGCAGGNAIDRAVPQAALAQSSAPLPDPALPDGVPAQDVAAGETLPAAGTENPPAGQASRPDPLFESSGQAAVTGAYPNINNEPRGAVAQLTDEQRDALVSQMEALAAAHAQGNVSSAEYRRRLAQLQNLAATHSQATIDGIEN